MCGRFTRISPRDVLTSEFGITTFVNVDVSPRYNIAPSQPVEAIIRHGEERRLGPMKWGFSSTNSTLAPINARAETVASSRLFREAFQRRPCLVVADGFYEWQRNGRTKTPYFIHLRSARPFGFAGIFSIPRTEAAKRMATCAIVTCAANDLVAPIHDRMPVIVPAAARDRGPPSVSQNTWPPRWPSASMRRRCRRNAATAILGRSMRRRLVAVFGSASRSRPLRLSSSKGTYSRSELTRGSMSE